MDLVKCSLYLFGKTGTGKSSTGNTILGRRAFIASSSSTASTTTVQSERVTLRNGWTVDVVDGPGLVGLDSGFSTAALREFKRLIDSAPGRGHVFLIVCRYGERFTSEDSGMVKILEEEFGSDVFAHHGVVVVTCGNNFIADYDGEDVTFESWCKDQRGDFGKLVAACGGRVVLIDNSPGGNLADDLVEKLNNFLPGMAYGTKPFATARDEADNNPFGVIGLIISFFKRYKKPILFSGAVVLLAVYLLCSGVVKPSLLSERESVPPAPSSRDIANATANGTVNATANGTVNAMVNSTTTSTTKTPDL